MFNKIPVSEGVLLNIFVIVVTDHWHPSLVLCNEVKVVWIGDRRKHIFLYNESSQGRL